MPLTEAQEQDLSGHALGNPNCKACCCGPWTCPECGGQGHKTSVDEEEDTEGGRDWVHDVTCEKCGKEWRS